MPPNHDLKHALQSVAAAERPAGDPTADLARARAAASARNRRRFRLGLSGLTAVTVLGVTSAALFDDGPAAPPETPAADAPSVTTSGVQLVAETLDATPYTFDLTPAGWSVQAQHPQAVTIAPDDGSTSDEPLDFRGKLVIMLDTNPPGNGRRVELDGRTFWVSENSGYTTVATRTRADEPAGMVRIQYPRDAGWDEATMVEFLGSVHVGPGALPGLG